MVGLIATTLLAGARMPAGATSNMKRKIPRDAADRIAVAGPERDVRNLVPFLRREKCFFLTSPFIEPRFWEPLAAPRNRGVAPAPQIGKGSVCEVFRPRPVKRKRRRGGDICRSSTSPRNT